MTRRPFPSLAVLSLLAAPAIGFAQSQTSANEDERLEALIRESETVYVPKSTFTVGFRLLNSGPKTNFGNLGTVPNLNVIAPASEGAVNRIYDNGAVGADAKRSDETAGTNGRYQTYTAPTDGSTPVLTGDYLSFAEGRSRAWRYSDESQATAKPGYIAMSNYSATSGGGAAYKEQGFTAGVELQMEYRLTKPTRRLQVSVVAGVALSGINNKTSGSVVSNLRTQTDYYSLNGQAAPAINETTGSYQAPDVATITNDEGVFVRYQENTIAINQTPDETLREDNTVANGVTVDGNWQVKGNYFLLRLGPLVRTQLTERLGLSASVGMAGAYAGTRYTAIETFTVDGADAAMGTEEFSIEKKFLSGYYADFNVEFAANERAGFFGGVTAQQLGDYTQSLGDRTATVDLGNAVGLRGGMSIKF